MAAPVAVAAIAKHGANALRAARTALAARAASQEHGDGFDITKAVGAIVVAALLIFSLIGAMRVAEASKLSDAVEAYRGDVTRACLDCDVDTKWVNLILAMMQQESGGNPEVSSALGARADVMQAAEGAYGWIVKEGWSKFNVSPNTTKASIYAGTLEFQSNLELWESWLGEIDVEDTDKLKLIVQGYNYGSQGWFNWCKANNIRVWTLEKSQLYSNTKMPANAKGTPSHANLVMQYYTPHGVFAATSGSIPTSGLAIPLYLQTDSAWGSVSYPYASGGSSSIAASACGPTSFAMVATYLTGKNFTPPDVLLGGKYHVGGGTSWSYFARAAQTFGCGSVVQTGSWTKVRAALLAGHPVICSQGPGLFTNNGHFIVLRGINSQGKVLVNDPNDSESKNYINRAFEPYQVTSTARQYWIFETKG